MNHQSPAPNKRRSRRALRWLGITLLAYGGSYFVLSLTGGWVVTESGRTRLVTAVADTFEWQPRYGSCQQFLSITGDYSLRADALGYFYAPLILLDQRFIHRSIRFIADDGSFIEPSPAPPLADFHAIRSNRWQGRFPYDPMTATP